MKKSIDYPHPNQKDLILVIFTKFTILKEINDNSNSNTY